MTPKKKAFELIVKFQHPISKESNTDCLHIKVAKEFALIAVDEILNIIDEHNITTWDADIFKYWFEVKLEINNL